jgi:hypothetical protein
MGGIFPIGVGSLPFGLSLDLGVGISVTGGCVLPDVVDDDEDREESVNQNEDGQTQIASQVEILKAVLDFLVFGRLSGLVIIAAHEVDQTIDERGDAVAHVD